MVTQTEIDAALTDAQQAVDTLARDVATLDPAPAEADAPAAVPSAPPDSGEISSQPAAASHSKPSRSPRSGAAPGAADPLAALSPRLARVLKLSVPVVVRLADRRLRLSEILKLTPGNIIEFERTVDSDLDLLVNNQPIGSGKAVKVNERFGLRILKIGDARTRLAQATGG